MSSSSRSQPTSGKGACITEPDRRQAKLLLALIDIAKAYAAPGATEATPVLRDVSLQILSGESVAIVGPSGSGKSTLLNIIGALDRPDAGQVLLDGRDLSTLSESELAAIRCREIGFVFQLHHLLPQCTVLENVLVPTLAMSPGRGDAGARRHGDAETRGRGDAEKEPSDLAASATRCAGTRPRVAASPRTGGEDRIEAPEERARRLLERVGLAERLSHRPGQLSGGERQRVAVVRALINEPKLLLADEPTGSLDRAAADNLAQLLVELNREEGVSLIVVTHAMDLARQMGRVLELRDGCLIPA